MNGDVIYWASLIAKAITINGRYILADNFKHVHNITWDILAGGKEKHLK